MDVSPQELRSSEIKDAWRGYSRDEVDDLLERAAVTIEGLTRQLVEVEKRAPDDPEALPTNREDAEMLQRTLLLAQRAADEEVSKAQAQARKLIEESEARAQALVGEAESTARRIAEGERRRLEDEISDLTRRRDRLSSDADSLEVYVASYRERVREAITQDLERLGEGTISPPRPRPTTDDADRGALSKDTAERPTFGALGEEGESVLDLGVEEEPSLGLPDLSRQSESSWPPPAESAATEADASRADAKPVMTSPSHAQQGSATSSGGWLREPEPVVAESFDAVPPWESATAEHEPFSSETPLEATTIDSDDDLDDDAFFSSLRDAVRDDAPLGSLDEHDAFFDEPVDERRGHFRRRR